MKTNPIATICLLIIFSFSCSKKVVGAQKTVEDKPLSYKIVDKIDKPSEKEVKQAAPAFFKVAGTEGYWKLEISADAINYISDYDKDNVTVPYVTPIAAADSNVKLYRSKSGGNELEITVSQNDCNDGISKTRYGYVVKVGLKRAGDKEFKYLKGCGNYVPDQRLNKTWTLSKIGKQKVTPEDFGKELPYMDLHVDINSFTGFGGCNRMKGTFSVTDANLIRFTDVISTKMMCLENNKEPIFMKALATVTQYEIKDHLLYLYTGNETALVFKN